ncbi:hypothetical protein ACJX0J_011687, partial [Zea mays]
VFISKLVNIAELWQGIVWHVCECLFFLDCSYLIGASGSGLHSIYNHAEEQVKIWILSNIILALKI